MTQDLGQHFLIDKKILDLEVKIAKIKKKESIIEIGAGTGALTKELSKKAGKVLAYEIDEQFKPALDEIEKENENLKIIYGDALKQPWSEADKIVSNIPYHLSEQTILKSIEDDVKELILIVGENFKKILEEKKTKTGIIADLFFDFEAIEKIPKSAFSPIPRTDSYLIKLKRKKETSKFNVNNILEQIISKNGKIKNAILYSLVEKGKTKNEAREIISSLGVHDTVLEKPVKSITGEFLSLLRERLEGLI